MKKKKESIITGTTGAFLGSLLGVLCIVLMGQLGYVASASGLVMGVCALKGYELLGGGMSKKGVVISGVIILIMTLFAHRLNWAVVLARELEIGIFESFRAIGYLLEIDALEGVSYWGDLIMLYFFTLLGAVPAIVSGLRSTQSAVIPAGTENLSLAESEKNRGLTVYAAQKGWGRRLRISLFVAICFPLLTAVCMVVLAVVFKEHEYPFVFAAFGALAGCIIADFASIPTMQLCKAYNVVLVQDESGVFWQVQLSLFNQIESYRFSSNLGLWRALRWYNLSEEEQGLFRSSVSRAMEDMVQGRIFKGSALTRALTPLTGMELVKENAWRWRMSCQTQNGTRQVSIPKAYPGLCPVPGTETHSEPVPFRAGLCIAAVICTVVLAAGGWAAGTYFANGGPAPQYPDPTVAAVPADAEAHELNGVTYQVDNAYVTQGNQYIDQETGAVFTVSVVHGADVSAAEERLIEPVGDHRMHEAYEHFQFDIIRSGDERDDNDSLYPLSALNGAEYQYNILSLYCEELTHVGAALMEDGTLIVVEAVHADRSDEAQVKAALLYILESAEAAGEGGATAQEHAELTEDNYQSFFIPLSDYGYEYVGLAYHKAPVSMFGYEAFVDAYLPYSDTPSYSEDGKSIQAEAHGVRVSQTIAYSEGNAQDVVDAAYQELVDAGTDMYEDGVFETQYSAEYDIACKQVLYFEENRTLARVMFIYADIKQDDHYLLAHITYLPEQEDSDSTALIRELSDVFSLSLPDM